jgi:arabinofuranosyltransferase
VPVPERARPAEVPELDERSGAPGRRRTVVQLAVLALPVVVLGVLAWTHRSIFYDGYIYLHVVQNILAGHGPVFDQGQRVEAFTSPLWTAILAVAGLLTPFHLTSVTIDLGILFTVAGLGLTTAASVRLVRRVDGSAFLVPVGAAIFMAVPAVWPLATLGLETGLVFLWTGVCLWILVRWSGTVDGRPPAWWVVVLGLGWLIRPELGVDSLVFVAALVCADHRSMTRTERARIVAWAVAVPLAYEVFRMGYYGMLVANTAVAKEATLPRPARGWRYFTDFAGAYWLVVPALCMVFGAYIPLAGALRRLVGHRRHLAALFALPVAGLANAAYVVVMGGDYIHGRLLVAPLLATCAPVAVVPATRRYAIMLLAVPWALLCGFTMRTYDGSVFSNTLVMGIDGQGSPGTTLPDWPNRPPYAQLARVGGAWVQFNPEGVPVRLTGAPPRGLAVPVIATAQIGVAYPLGTDVHILDLLGLADPLAAHLTLRQSGAYVGHEKPLPTAWVAALLTAPGTSTAQLGSLQPLRPAEYTALIPPVSGRALAVETAWARADLSCPAIAAVEYGPGRPLTVAGFFDNMIHAEDNTTVRIPPDPEDAYHAMCGPGTPPEVRAVEAVGTPRG